MPSPDRPVARRPHRAPSGDTYLTSDTGKQYEKENHNWMKTIKKEGNTKKNQYLCPIDQLYTQHYGTKSANTGKEDTVNKGRSVETDGGT